MTTSLPLVYLTPEAQAKTGPFLANGGASKTEVRVAKLAGKGTALDELGGSVSRAWV